MHIQIVQYFLLEYAMHPSCMVLGICCCWVLASQLISRYQSIMSCHKLGVADWDCTVGTIAVLFYLSNNMRVWISKLIFNQIVVSNNRNNFLFKSPPPIQIYPPLLALFLHLLDLLLTPQLGLVHEQCFECFPAPPPSCYCWWPIPPVCGVGGWTEGTHSVCCFGWPAP